MKQLQMKFRTRFLLIVFLLVLLSLLNTIPSALAGYTWSGVPGALDPPLIISTQDTLQVSITYSNTNLNCSGTEQYIDIGIQGQDLDNNPIFSPDNEGYRLINPGGATIVATFSNLPEGRYNAFLFALTNDPSQPFTTQNPTCQAAIAPNINVQVVSKIVPTRMPVGMVDIPYSQIMTTNLLTGPFVWGIVAGSLPNGVALNTSTGQVFGAPTLSGTFNFTIQVTDGNNATTSLASSMVVYPKSSYADFGTCGAITNFSSPQHPSSPISESHNLAVADFNNDGKQDVVVTSFAVNHPITLAIFLGNGAGGFAVASSIEAGAMVQGVAVADFNNDGKQDIAFATELTGPNYLSVMLGDGTGNFGPITTFFTGPGLPRTVEVGDFNGDGNKDLATAGLNRSGETSVLFGTGTGSFGAPQIVSVGSTAAWKVIVSDINNDGKLDLIAALRFSNQVSVVLGNGAGAFGPPTFFNVGSGPIALAVADFNGDGKKDLAVGNLDSNSNSVSILLGDGNGGFGAATAFSSRTQPISLAVADFNGNGTLDLAVANLTNDGTICILLGDGKGNFWVPTNVMNVGGQPWFVAASDFNSDGKPDLAVANLSLAIVPNNPMPVCIVSTPLTDATLGATYSRTLTTTGNATLLTWKVSEGSLPPGLALDASTGQISGVPNATGTFNFIVQAADITLTTVSHGFTVTVNPPPVITATTLPIGTVTVPYSQTIAATGSSPLTWAISTGSLPGGLSLNQSTGVISGTPTASGNFNFTVQVIDVNSAVASQALTIKINPALTITSTSPLPNAQVGSRYSNKLTATGGTAPFSWSVIGGSLPPGLSLNSSSGNISGKPTSAGTYTFTIQIIDVNSVTDSKEFSLTVN
jgi:hypothetical protein